MSQPRALLVATSCELMPDGRPTGVYASELVDSWETFEAAGFLIGVASPRGGALPVEARSDRDAGQRRFFEGAGGSAITRTWALASEPVTQTDWDVVLILGGHGAILDLASDPDLARLLIRVHSAGGVLAAVCHGVAGLLGGPDGPGSLVRGRSVAAFSNAEERAVGMQDRVPFQLEDRLAELGARYSEGPPFLPHVVVDGSVVTGQNPASARATAAKAAELVSSRSRAETRPRKSVYLP